MGTGRCGTQTLAHALAELPGFVSLHEGKKYSGTGPNLITLMGINALLSHGARRQTWLDQSRVPEGIPLKIMDASFASRHELIQKCEADGVPFFEANRMAHNYIDYIHARYPDARFIHVVRNGYNCALSWHVRTGAYPTLRSTIGAQWQGLVRYYIKRKGGGATLLDFLFDIYLRIIIRNPWPSAHNMGTISQITGRNMDLEKPVPFPSSEHAANWKRYSRLQKIAWYWEWTNWNIEERLRRIPKELKMTIRIEDLNTALFQQMMSFCGLTDIPTPERIPVRNATKNKKPTMTSADLSQFNAIAGARIQRLGYELIEEACPQALPDAPASQPNDPS